MRSAILIASSMSWVTNTIGLAQPALDVEELVLQPSPHDRVHRAERLVHQHHRRVHGQGPGHADPLPLAAGQLGRVPAEELGVEVEDADQLVDPRRGSGPCPSPPAAGRWPCSRRRSGAASGRCSG